MIINRPAISEYPEFYATYIQKVNGDDLIRSLQEGEKELIQLLGSIAPSKFSFRYAPGKWSIQEIISHIIDAERVFSYRALRFSRNDATALPGFDENSWVPESNASNRIMQDIISEYSYVRLATISLFKSFTSEMTLRSGLANGKRISVRALGYAIAGHELHHAMVIRERYLAET